MKITGFLILILTTFSAFAGDMKLITYSGRIIKPDNMPVDAASVNFTIKVYSPDPNRCLLWEEQQTVNMTGSNGVFTLEIGKTANRSSGLTQIDYAFKNTGSYAGLTCVSGSTYAPAVNEDRQLQVSFNDGTGVQTLSLMKIKSVPYAMYADKAGEATKVSGVEVSTNTPSNGQALVYNSASQKWEPQNVANGTNVPSALAPPAVGQDGQSLRWNNTTGQWEWFTPGVAGAGITTMNGQSGAAQSFNVTSTGTDFTINSGSNIHNFNLPSASATARGVLTSTDWTTFNNKQAAGSYITALTGDIAASGPGSAAATIANDAVNSAKILDGSVGVADLNFAGAMAINSGLLVRNGTQFFNKSCAGNEALIWSVANGWSCSAVVLTESDPNVSAWAKNASLQAADVPSLDAAKITTGAFNTARLGSGTADNTKYLRGDGTWQTLPSGADNLGNHTATQNLDLSTFKLVGNGGAAGINILSSGNVGVGTASPGALLDVNGVLRVQQICDGTGANCKTISTGWNNAQASHRYWRAYKTNAAAVGGYISELELYEAGTKLTLTTGMLSQSGLIGFNATTLIDTNTVTASGFHVDTSGVGSTLNIDLGAGNAKAVTEWRFYTASTVYANWLIQYSDDGSTWITSGTLNFGTGASMQTVSFNTNQPWSISGSTINYMSGNVGIGTTTPNSTLEVAGTIHSTTGGIKFPDGTVQTTSAVGGTNNTMISNWPDAIICQIGATKIILYNVWFQAASDNNAYYVAPWSTTYYISYNISSGNYNTHSNMGSTDCVTSGWSISQIISNGRNYNFVKGPAAQWLQNGSDAYYNAGKVGIGTSTPTSKFEIKAANGNQMTLDNAGEQWTQMSLNNNGGASNKSVFMGLDGTNNLMVLGAQSAYTGFHSIRFRPDGSTDALTIKRGGAVGIGNTNPNYMLEVNGTGVPFYVNSTNGNTNKISLADSGTVRGYIGASATSFFYAQNPGGTATVGVDNSGNMTISGSSYWTSDGRLKENVERIPASLDRLLNMNGVTYNWKPELQRSPDRQMGLIAQEVEKQFPEAVKYDEKGFRSVNYNALVAPVIESIKEIWLLITQTNDKVEKLESENMAMKKALCEMGRDEFCQK